ncbi:protein canopy homolog 4 [Emydura macquarii macquarii]|uniref:protein canopy homolog 4 n=1 Tax=Emydura macquarii macquarii TaxID=1129001 RepID=UPI00352A0D4F
MGLPLLVALLLLGAARRAGAEDERLPTPCEVCKYLSLELQETLARSSHSKEVLELGQVLDSGKRKRLIKYNTSETRLAEALEAVCERFLHYSVHAERPGSLRYAKGQSQTMSTLKNLMNKGVKVDLGIPLELWDEPSVEVTQLKQQCETMLERFEDVLEDWYFHHQETALGAFLCEGHVLGAGERACLSEVWMGQKGDEGAPGEEEEAEEEEETMKQPSPPTSHADRHGGDL